jgi:nucleotide-binding universal stress UspA family protein
MFKRILTPLDGSEASESILKWVAPLADSYGTRPGAT